MRIRIYSNDGNVCTKTLKAGTTFIVERGKITPLTLNSNNLDFSSVAGELPGLFSIAEGVQVRFSSGNMQYTTVGTHAVAEGGPAGGTWRFAPNQYDYIGKGNENISETYTGWIDLFGWGTSGWSESGASLYQPYHYNGLGTGDGYNPNDPNGGPVLNNNLTGSYANADWAVYNAISNGGNQPGVWRTLTGAEWTYLINRAGKRGAGSINGVGGMILLPDDWTKPEDCNFTAAFSDEQNVWGPNNYTLAQWAKMEAAGAVFLPAAGYRGVQSKKPYLAFVGSQGYYWSTTRWNNWNAMNYLYFSYQDFNGENLHQQNFNDGLSVRPVRVITSSQQ